MEVPESVAWTIVIVAIGFVAFMIWEAVLY